MRTIERECVVGFVISKDNKFLLGKKRPKSGGVYVTSWHLPGGGIDKGETEREALKREMLEETDFDIDDAESVELFDDEGTGVSEKTLKDTGEVVLCHMKFKVFEIRTKQNATDVPVKPTEELGELMWADLERPLDYELTPPSVDMFTRHGFGNNPVQ